MPCTSRKAIFFSICAPNFVFACTLNLLSSALAERILQRRSNDINKSITNLRVAPAIGHLQCVLFLDLHFIVNPLMASARRSSSSTFCTFRLLPTSASPVFAHTSVSRLHACLVQIDSYLTMYIHTQLVGTDHYRRQSQVDKVMRYHQSALNGWYQEKNLYRAHRHHT
jgi:hypothetical protein